MHLTHCDICRKRIKENGVTAGKGFWPRFDFCKKCGKPILKFLQKHKLIARDKKEKKS